MVLIRVEVHVRLCSLSRKRKGVLHECRPNVVSRDEEPLNIHASAVAVGDRAALILGRSGAGKSRLALRMIALGADLVADDRVDLIRDGDRLMAAAPEALRGLAEARGVGLLRLPSRAGAELCIAVDLDAAPVTRMPPSDTITYLGVPLDLISAHGVPDIDVILTLLLRHGCAEPG